MKTWNIEELTNYKPKTTFYEDFSIADHFGITAIEDTYKCAFEDWKDNYEFLTELVMVLNWKLWEHYEEGRYTYAELYDALWREADEYATTHLTDEELLYFYTTID